MSVDDRLTSDEVFLRVVATAQEELERGGLLLLLSGVAAGLTAGTSLLASLPIISHLGGGPEAELAGALAYGLGFVLIVLGRYQLFTENTLSPVMLVLHRKRGISVLLRLWGFVLAGNLIGAATIGSLLSVSGVFDTVASEHLISVARHAVEESWSKLLWLSVFAGALVASMMWLVIAVRESTARILIIMSIAAIIPLAGLHHCVFGTTEVLYAVLHNQANLLEYGRFLILALLGNTLGGVIFVSLINFAQTRSSGIDDGQIGDEPANDGRDE